MQYLTVRKELISRQILSRFIHTSRCVRTIDPDILEEKALDPRVRQLYDRHKSAILYSSVVESSKLNLGYVKSKILTQKLKAQQEKLTVENVRVKPFSLALKYWDESKKDFDGKVISDANPNNTQWKSDLINEISNSKRKRQLLREMQQSQSLIGDENDPKPFTNYWMNDYDIYDDSESEAHSQFGTPDPSVPVSKVPCYGCGSLLQCADSSLPGYLPSELFKGKNAAVLKTVHCQRCHFLKNYNTAINMNVSSDQYVEMISTIEDKFALAILMIDLLDFPCSLWPGIASILGNKRPIFVVGNKVDLLPKDSPGHINHVKRCLEDCIANSGIARTNVKHVALISAQTGYGVEELITKLHNVWQYKGDVYVVGCTNVGKSTLFNALLRSDYCKVKASNIIQKATASPWPGTTIRLLKFPILRPNDHRLYERTMRLISQSHKRAAENQLRADQARLGKVEHATLIGHIGRTFEQPEDEVIDSFSMGKGAPKVLHLNEASDDYAKSKWCFDTPGVVHNESILNLLTTEELLLTLPKKMILPRTFVMKPGMSLFLAGVGRVDYLSGVDYIRITVYASPKLPVLIVKTDEAETVYSEMLGTELLAVPVGDAERLNKWPGLAASDVFTFRGEGTKVSACDVLLSSAGWVGLIIPENEEADFKIWTPEARGIFVRRPSLIPFGGNLHGGRIRGTLAYRTRLPFVKPTG
ncbi:hypothetical protein HA402_003697 [Bradysia odoriphaga]|nr:hypothetical protein HA402_003697 [Bradysia odoriphaga]